MYEEVPDPRIESPLDVIVRVGGAGVCRTDLHVIEALWRDKVEVTLPYVMGHENAGWVEEVGSGVEGLAPGAPVICHPLVSGGYSLAARRGNDMHAPDGVLPGINANGGYADLLKTNARTLVPLPQSLAPKDVAPYADAGLTAYRAAKKASRHLLPGEYAVIIGAGGLGHIGLQSLRALCAAAIIVVDRSETARGLAQELGADHVVAADGDEVEAVRELTGGSGAEAVNDFVGEGGTTDMGLAMTRNASARAADPGTAAATGTRRKSMGRLDDKVAIVTGAAGGIGGAICRHFLSEGARVLALDINPGPLAPLAAESGGRCLAHTCDVSSESDIDEAVDRTAGTFGGLDVIVNNAISDLPLAPLTEISLADWRRTWAVNVDGAFLLSRAAIPRMESGGGGSIIHIASQLGRTARPGRPWYCAQKGALISLAQAMALDHAAQGIRVNCLSPGPVETDRYLRNFPSRAAAQESANTMLGRLGQPDEIAAGAVFLASDESSYMTGADLLIDGGYTAW